MASVNKVIIVGNLGRDPELRYMPDGNAACNLSVATTYSWKDKASGEKREETEWHRVVMYGRLAEVAGEYLVKGSPAYIEGRIRTRKWEKEGVERYTTEIVADHLQMLGKKPDGAGDRETAGAATSDKPAAEKSYFKTPPPEKKPAGKFDDMVDDIPF